MFSSKMFLPDNRLKDWIKVYWFFEGLGSGAKSCTRHILPDGCATIVLVLKGEIDLTIYENGKLSRGIYVIPPVVKAHHDTISDDISFIDVQLNPGIFYKLFGQSIDELENRVHTFDEISIPFEKSILDEIDAIKEDKMMVYMKLNNFFSKIFDKMDFYPDDIILNISELYKFGNLEKFFSEQRLSVRQVERKVKRFTGLSPKSISRVSRFYNILEYMKFREFNLEFTDLALEHNFSDQSHFIREFKNFSNISPGKFIKSSKEFPQYIGLCQMVKIINNI